MEHNNELQVAPIKGFDPVATPSAAEAKASQRPEHIPPFSEFADAVRGNALAKMGARRAVLFRTTVSARSIYLGMFPATAEEGKMSERQFHNCNHCIDFLDRIGDLVYIDEGTGKTTSLLWNEFDVDPYYQPIVKRLREEVEKAPVIGPYLSMERSGVASNTYTAIRDEVGVFAKNGYHHFYLPLPAHIRTDAPFGSQEEAEQYFDGYKKQLMSYTKDTITKAGILFAQDPKLAGYDSFKAAVEWIDSFHTAFENTKHAHHASNLVWIEAVKKQGGRFNFDNTVTGQFLSDLQNGVEQEAAIRILRSKAAPERYMRPTEGPSQGTIEQAEALFKEKGWAPSLERRYMRIDEIPVKLWEPEAPPAKTASEGGLFSHLTAKNAPEQVPLKPVDAGVMTWEKFLQKVLPTAAKIAVTFEQSRRYPLLAYTTAVYPDAPPILRHDKLEQRNPAISFMYMDGPNRPGLMASDYGLPYYEPVDVLCLTVLAHSFGNSDPSIESGPVLVLAKGEPPPGPGLALFPEMLVPELHAVRSVVEAHSNSRQLPNPKEAFPCLLMGAEYLLTVTHKDGTVVYYRIDRIE